MKEQDKKWLTGVISSLCYKDKAVILESLKRQKAVAVKQQ
jgi:hypothetical protein